jgi:Arc/MetJ-type ribon-helix-helix transcriptional regulator
MILRMNSITLPPELEQYAAEAVAAGRWNLTISRRTDSALRRLLARQGGARKGALSRVVEEAVQARIFALEVEQAKAHNAKVPQEAIEAAVDEALEWARRT